ncbi:putative high-affinity glucose transporter [Meira miltonrushii]|uniref:Putative high-affinity glucose transporter n=1 Tax=Meira miltonrushii TaxID=1280837 RepID=A0A316VDX9_9BASI|nr:putative high-affinity glucose transporter [Meira miltonrushii]PWN35849.1 putative high-affinity glucose transporter [Meira miltonrushii]
MKTISNPYVVTALGCVGGLLFGFDIASMSAILPTANYKVYFNGGNDPPSQAVGKPLGWLDSTGPSSDVQGGITASMAGGSFLGAIVSGLLTDKLGRRNSIFVSTIIFVIGSIITCAAQAIGMLVVGRLICGFAIGIASAQVPVYISELVPSRLRGRLVGCQQWAITWGIMVFYYVSLGCSYAAPQDGRRTITFRLPWALQMIPAIFLMFLVPFMPRSPRWLASKGRYEEARQVLALVHAKGDVSSPLVLAEMKEIQDSIEAESGKGSGFTDLFKGRMLYRIHIGIFTQIWSQLTGMNVMMYYIGYVFQMAGVSDTSQAVVSSSIQYVINVVMTVPALIWIDKWGRRPTLLIGAALMALWLFINAGIMAQHGHYVTEAERQAEGLSQSVAWRVDITSGKAVIAMSYLFVASYAPTWGPVSWVYPPELFPTRLRGKANAISTCANWIFNFALGYFVPPAFENIQWKVYLIFGVFNVAMFIHVFFCFVETKGKTLEEVEEVFNSGLHAWQTRKLTETSRVEQMATAIAQGEKVENLDRAVSPSEHDVKSPDSELSDKQLGGTTHVA